MATFDQQYSDNQAIERRQRVAARLNRSRSRQHNLDALNRVLTPPWTERLKWAVVDMARETDWVVVAIVTAALVASALTIWTVLAGVSAWVNWLRCPCR